MDTSSILPDDMIAARLQNVNVAWTAIGNDYLVRAFKTENFAAGVALVQKIAKVAEAANHHPDINLTYSRVEVRLSTHAVAGITEADFALARDIDHATN